MNSLSALAAALLFSIWLAGVRWRESLAWAKAVSVAPLSVSAPQHPAFVEQNKIHWMAERFNALESDIAVLRKEKMGWSELVHLYVLAEKSDQPPQTILAWRRGGMSWQDIARRVHLHFSMVQREVTAVRSELKKIEKGLPAEKTAAMGNLRLVQFEPSREERLMRLSNLR